MRKAVFLTGASCAGKTYFRKKWFSDVPCVDLMSYQLMGNQAITAEAEKRGLPIIDEWYWRLQLSETMCMDDFRDMVQDERNEVSVLEHMLSSRERRQVYIQKIRDVFDGEIVYILLKPDEEKLNQNAILKVEDTGLKSWETLDSASERIVNEAKAWYEVCDKEPPSMDDGMDHLFVIKDSDNPPYEFLEYFGFKNSRRI